MLLDAITDDDVASAGVLVALSTGFDDLFIRMRGNGRKQARDQR